MNPDPIPPSTVFLLVVAISLGIIYIYLQW